MVYRQEMKVSLGMFTEAPMHDLVIITTASQLHSFLVPYPEECGEVATEIMSRCCSQC